MFATPHPRIPPTKILRPTGGPKIEQQYQVIKSSCGGDVFPKKLTRCTQLMCLCVCRFAKPARRQTPTASAVAFRMVQPRLSFELKSYYHVEEDIRCRNLSKGGDRMPTSRESEDGAALMKHLSKSEQAKVHMARALIMNPEVLVIQQPFRYYVLVM